jgi:putative oxidoreductase
MLYLCKHLKAMALKIIFCILIAAYVIPGFIFGFKKLTGNKQSVARFKKWGYPLWFMHLLGLTEMINSSLMLFNPTRIYGIAIFPMILAGAVYTHVKFGETGEVKKPIFVSTLLAAIFLFTFWI